MKRVSTAKQAEERQREFNREYHRKKMEAESLVRIGAACDAYNARQRELQAAVDAEKAATKAKRLEAKKARAALAEQRKAVRVARAYRRMFAY